MAGCIYPYRVIEGLYITFSFSVILIYLFVYGFLVEMKSLGEMLEDGVGAFGVGWVWLHVFLIFVFKEVLIYEEVRWIITLELFVLTVIFVFWIVRLVRTLRI